MHLILIPVLLFIQGVAAHVAAFHWGMYCLNGLQEFNNNSFEVVLPLYKLDFNDWFLHGRCKDFPPPDGAFLDLPAGGSFTVEIAGNRGQTSYAFDGKFVHGDWPDGEDHPEDMNMSPECVTSPNLHTQNESMAAGTAFAISYTSDIHAVTQENLVVFSILEHTPWKRVVTYQVPGAMPACPSGGCICAWGWVPNGCGVPNMYQHGFRCRVTGATSTIPVGPGQPPVWCEGEPGKCRKGPKQMISWNQNTGNNIEVDGFDLSGGHKSPAYNTKCGFWPGAQNDIFVGSPAQNEPPPTTQDPPPSSNGVPTTTPAPLPTSYPPIDTTRPISNATTPTSTSTTRSRPTNRCIRSTLGDTKLVKKSIAEGVAAHFKRRRLGRRSL